MAASVPLALIRHTRTSRYTNRYSTRSPSTSPPADWCGGQLPLNDGSASGSSQPRDRAPSAGGVGGRRSDRCLSRQGVVRLGRTPQRAPERPAELHGARASPRIGAEREGVAPRDPRRLDGRSRVLAGRARCRRAGPGTGSAARRATGRGRPLPDPTGPVPGAGRRRLHGGLRGLDPAHEGPDHADMPADAPRVNLASFMVSVARPGTLLARPSGSRPTTWDQEPRCV